jgi:hypothetical protein
MVQTMESSLVSRFLILMAQSSWLVTPAKIIVYKEHEKTRCKSKQETVNDKMKYVKDSRRDRAEQYPSG